jgi:hypothetical protein
MGDRVMAQSLTTGTTSPGFSVSRVPHFGSVALGIALLSFFATPLQAANLTGGVIAKFVNKAGTARDIAIIKFAKDPAIAAPLPDPTSAVSAIRFYSDTSDTGTVLLDQSKWRSSGTGFVYKADPKSAPPGGIFKIVFKPGKSGGKLIIKAKREAYGVNAVAGPIAFVEVGFTVGGSAYTGRFEAPPAEVKSNTQEKVILKGKGISVPAAVSCAQIGSACESLEMDPLLVVSWEHATGISTVANQGSEQLFSLRWVPAGDFVDLAIGFPGQPSQDLLQVDGPLLPLADTNTVGLVIAGLNPMVA